MKQSKIILIAFFLLLTSIHKASALVGVDQQPSVTAQNSDQKLTVDKVDQSDFSTTAILQGLDKVNGKSSELRVRVGGQVEFGKIIIKAKKCWRAPPDQRPENKILLQIEEPNSDGTKKILFYGWMFSSSPSISGLEHPVYDVTAIACQR